MSVHQCRYAGCTRKFLDIAALEEHADAVHSFNDIQGLLRDSLKEKYARGGDANGRGQVCVWISDVATDWVVFQVETDTDCNLYKANYTIDANNAVTLSDPIEVVQRTVYEPIAASTLTPAALPGLEGAAAKTAKKAAAPKAAAPAGTAPDANMAAAQKTLSAPQFGVYKQMRGKGMPHAVAMAAAKKAKA